MTRLDAVTWPYAARSEGLRTPNLLIRGFLASWSSCPTGPCHARDRRQWSLRGLALSRPDGSWLGSSCGDVGRASDLGLCSWDLCHRPHPMEALEGGCRVIAPSPATALVRSSPPPPSRYPAWPRPIADEVLDAVALVSARAAVIGAGSGRPGVAVSALNRRWIADRRHRSPSGGWAGVRWRRTTRRGGRRRPKGWRVLRFHLDHERAVSDWAGWAHDQTEGWTSTTDPAGWDHRRAYVDRTDPGGP